MLTDQKIEKLAAGVLRLALQGYGYHHVNVHSGPDYDDTPAVFIDVVLQEHTPAVRGDVINSAATSLRRELLKYDELRFPYLSLVHPDEANGDEEPQSQSTRSDG